MLARLAPGPRPAALVFALLILLGVVAAGPAGGAANEADFVRVTVQFDEAPLASYRDTIPGLKGVQEARTPDGHLNVKAPASRAYLAHLKAFTAQASSLRGAAITKYRWDFGDGSPIVETTVPTVTHEYGKDSRGTYEAHVEAVNALSRSGVATATVIVRRN
jgi:hypothetical protein